MRHGSEIIRAWREAEGLTQEEAAALAPCSQEHWSDLERAKKMPGVALAVRLSELTRGSKHHCRVESWAVTR